MQKGVCIMPSTDVLHGALTGTNIHIPYRFTYADTAAREAATPTAADVGCLALQQDDQSLWLLVDDDPLTWVAVADAGGSQTAQVADVIVVIQSAVSGDPIASGQYVDVEMPWAGTINQVTMMADRSGSIVVDLWLEQYADYPPTNDDSITAAAPPTISAATKSQDSTLTDWTTAFSAGDIIRAYVESCTDIEQVSLCLQVTRS